MIRCSHGIRSRRFLSTTLFSVTSNSDTPMTIFQFMSESPLLTFFMFYMLTATAFRCWNCFMRHLNIRKHGWPPAHCDADGDFKPDPEPEDESPENS